MQTRGIPGDGESVSRELSKVPQGAALVGQWLRIRLAMQGTWVPGQDPWSRKIPHAEE